MPTSEEKTDESAVMLSGRSMVGFSTGQHGGATFRAFDPQTGSPLEPAFISISREEADRAVELAAIAAPVWGRAPGTERAEFLRAVASSIERIAESVIERAHAETA